MSRLIRHMATAAWIRSVAFFAIAFVTCAPSASICRASAVPQQPASAAASEAAPPASVSSIGITVSDLDKAVQFYTGVLTFEKIWEHEGAGESIENLSGVFGARCRVARLKLGEEFIELTEYLAPQSRPIPVDSRSNDRWFQHIAIVVSDMDAAYAKLRENKVRHASTGPQTIPTWNPNAGGISAFYFKDPDGHVLEVIHFPAEKGDPRWQRGAGRLFLGIDHTAIVVSDTDRSASFYKDVLGMRIAGASENYGTEQEHLNNVFGAKLQITALRGAHGPGVELLEYLAPGDGGAYPSDARASDLLHWSTQCECDDVTLAALRARSARATWISPGVVSGVPSHEGTRNAFQIRDPDGHAIQCFSGPQALPQSQREATQQ